MKTKIILAIVLVCLIVILPMYVLADTSTYHKKCPECSGSGRSYIIYKCDNCDGTGKVFDLATALSDGICTSCKGTGRGPTVYFDPSDPNTPSYDGHKLASQQGPCNVCDGKGRIYGFKFYLFKTLWFVFFFAVVVGIFRFFTGGSFWEGAAEGAVEGIGQGAGEAVRQKAASSGCFIATACCGSYEHPDVVALRQFRDRILLPTTIGKTVVNTYYQISPPIAKVIARRKWLKSVVRFTFIRPAAYLARFC